jgi:hypothetical protein
VRLVPPQRNPPKEIRLFVRHPQDKPIRNVTAAGKPLTSFDAGAVTLRNLCGPLTLELRYESQ